MKKTKEQIRAGAYSDAAFSPWRKWGAYLSERSWGTVREDYSENGDAWNYFTHDMARSKAYRWGEDGIAGFSDYFQTMAFALAFWNGKDPILKERIFGLTPSEGNHGEDVKDFYYYVDATPTQSYMKYQYKYPQGEFPYQRLIEENQKRTEKDREFELQDTGIFTDGRYFDIIIEYAKNEEEDICIKIEAFNRGPDKAPLHILPHLWFRNRWSWKDEEGNIPSIFIEEEKDYVCLLADPCDFPQPATANFHYECPMMYLYGKTPKETLFTHNETAGENSRTKYVKDAFHRYIVNKEPCISPDKNGTKACFHYEMEVEPGSSSILLLRFSSKKQENPLEDVEDVIHIRQAEADAFYEAIQNSELTAEDKQIQREALAGMIWSQQLYIYDVKQWLSGDSDKNPAPEGRGDIRNGKWSHLYACDVLSMPDKWEYPWFAAWDLSFHTVALALVDLKLAKDQLILLLRHWFQHVNGQIPAYEWNFSDLNPPVQAWALWKLYLQGEREDGEGDREFLLFGFLKLVENFSWWVNKVDQLGNNVFEGGFLGLDNISLFDRSTPLSNGRIIEQSDATGWMGLYSLIMMKIALVLAKKDPVYQNLATTFFENFIYISSSIHDTKGMWDEEDEFFYDVVIEKGKKPESLKVKSFVGIIPFYSLTCIEEDELKSHKNFYENLLLFQKHNKEKVDRCLFKSGNKMVFSLMSMDQMEKVLMKAFDPDEFLSEYGIRSVSKYHEKHPLVYGDGCVGYEPGESLEKIKGGNSNWRGPIWIPTNFLFLDAIRKLIECVGPEHCIQCSDGSSKTLEELHKMLRERLTEIFRKNEKGDRPVHGDCKEYQEDPYFKDLLLFYEHYHGDTGRGLGASHQTGWSGLIANIISQL
jgi:hypothetical protein